MLEQLAGFEARAIRARSQEEFLAIIDEAAAYLQSVPLGPDNWYEIPQAFDALDAMIERSWPLYLGPEQATA